MYTPLPRSFYDRDPSIVAPQLLQKLLVRVYNGTFLIGKISEVEAYLPYDDAASHGCKGRTPSRESLFTQGGNAYVYGMRQHYLCNAVTEAADRPGAVLIRSVVPISGIDTMLQLRNKESIDGLTNGPGNVCQALAISKEHDGINLARATSALYIADAGDVVDPHMVVCSPRIGVTNAVDKLLRFTLKDT